MRIRLIFLLFLGTLFILLSCHTGHKESTQISYPKYIQLGGTALKDSISGSFYVVNEGNAPLKISGIGTGCDCIVASYDSSFIQTGDSTPIYFKIHLKDTGNFEKSIVFEANTDSIYHVVYIKGHAKRSNVTSME